MSRAGEGLSGLTVCSVRAQIIPAPFCSIPTDEALGSHCFEYVRPDFREHVREGYTVVVGGKAFGCGSSREEAARALKGE